MPHTPYMQRALELAQYAETQGGVPVGAVLVLDNEIIAEGYNQPISSNDPTAHAEMVALRQAAQHVQNYRLPHTTLYVTLEPCAMCAGALQHARIQRLVFGASDPKTGAIHSVYRLLDQPLNHVIEWQSGVLAEECGHILREFFKKKRV